MSALRAGAIGGAALDVFRELAVTSLFVDQLRRYRAGLPLRNVVDKRLGFLTAG